MRVRFVIVAICATSLAVAAAAEGPHAHHGKSPRPDDHAPIGVMGEHMHGAGGFMFSYRYARMHMDGNRDGTERQSLDQILLPGGNFLASPTDMDMQMHMFGAMYGATDWLTLMAMIPYVRLSMDHRNAMGVKFTTKSDGPGDLRLSGMLRLFENEHHHVHLNAGLSFPTGGLSHRDEVPVPMMGFLNRRLPYPMQIGSGTWDLLPGLTYNGSIPWLSWGAQLMGTIRTGKNKNHYRLGDRADTTAWVAAPLLDWLSVSGRIAYAYWGNIDGADRALDPAAIPTADPDRRAGHRIELLGGVNFVVPLGPLGDHRLSFEGGAPVYQWLDGPQLETDWRITVGWQLAF